jgi:hypothetical protein
MTAHWETIADCLREEIAEYGGLLHLFEVQQDALSARDTGSVLRHGNAINALARKLTDCRARRDKVVEAFAVRHGSPAGCSLRSLLPLIKADARPLLEALVDETNHLLRRVRRTSRRNHTLLAGAATLQQETLQLLRPPHSAKRHPHGRSTGSHHLATPLRVSA